MSSEYAGARRCMTNTCMGQQCSLISLDALIRDRTICPVITQVHATIETCMCGPLRGVQVPIGQVPLTQLTHVMHKHSVTAVGAGM